MLIALVTFRSRWNELWSDISVFRPICEAKVQISWITLAQETTMKAIEGYFLITLDDLHWRPSNLMKIPNADFLERTGSPNLAARLWRFPPKSANTLHKHL